MKNSKNTIANRVFIITNPMTSINQSSQVTTSKFIRTISPVYKRKIIVGGNVQLENDIKDTEIVSFRFDKKESKLKKVEDMISLQRKVAHYLSKEVTSEDEVIFWLGDKMVLPFLEAKRKTKHVGYFIYGNLATEEKSSLFMKASAKLVMFMANRADRVFVESKAVADGWGNQLKKSVSELHLYTDMVRFNPIENRQKKLGMLCRLASVKHVLESIQAFAELHREYPDWKMELIGSGKLEEECKRLIKELEAEDYIRLWGWVNHDQVEVITNEWNFNMLASDHEGLPNSLIEMMGKGVPVIATPVGGIPDLLQEGVNGYVLRGTSVSDIKEGMIKALTSENYEVMAKNAFETVESRYSLEKAQKETKAVLSGWRESRT